MSHATGMPVLEINGAIPEPVGSRLPSAPLNLVVTAGESVLIEIRSPSQAREFVDLCCGLLPLRSGSVRFLGRDWADTQHELASALRGHIGRLYGAEAWIGFLPVDTNILLPMLHHTRQPEAVLRAAATELAIRFGLPGLPASQPDALTAADLVRAACIRAFLGEPRLLLLDNPEVERVADLVPALLNAAMAAHDNQAASVWIMRSDAEWNDRSFPANMRLRLTERGLVPVSAPQ
jgi:phospholipid/cholesterol/gamma-HCH transport system ATP-binding protein